MLYTKKTFVYDAQPQEADIALIGIPFDSTELGRPVRYGPLFVREAIKNLIGWDQELKINIFEKYKFFDLGNIEVVPGNWKLTEDRIQDTIDWLFNENKKIFPVCIGGEHLITLGILSSLKKFFKEKITVIDFDAHFDLKDDWLGEKFSHISWAKQLIKDKKFELIQVGCRAGDKEEFEQAIKKSIKKTENPVYLTFDLDVFDPFHASEVGTPEPFGLTPIKVFELLKKACKNKLIGLDIVECASDKLHSNTAMLSAQVFKKVLGWRAKNERIK